MSQHTATVEWQRGDAVFTDRHYSRVHTWTFDGGTVVPATAAPSNVRPQYSRPDAVDPEEAFVAALSSCHMLWFLDIAARRGFTVDSYRDEAVGTMGKDTSGRTAITDVLLRPAIVFAGGKQPTREELAEMHDAAHDECFIANSVKSTVRVESPDAA